MLQVQVQGQGRTMNFHLYQQQLLLAQQQQQQQQQQQLQNTSMQSMASSINSGTNNPSDGVIKSCGLPLGAFDTSATNTMNFFQQQAAGSSRNSDTDIGAMDDVQFNASLDALLNGDQLGALSNSVVQGLTAGLPNLSCTTVRAPQQHHQSVFGNTQHYLVSAPAPQVMAQARAPAPQHQQQQQHIITFSAAAAQQLAGLPLTSANQGALQLVPPGPHSAAQMSLSAGHAAATGAFHPGNPTPTTTGLPHLVAAAPFPWAINTTVAAPAAPAPVPMNHAEMSYATAPISSATSVATKCSTTMSRTGKRKSSVKDMDMDMGVLEVSEDEGDRDKRRQERNQREQQRSHKINDQIATLRDVLSEANVPFKPDKYSTLTKVAEYIQELQDRSSFLDAEHKKLLDTIVETNEIVNNQYVPAYTSGLNTPSVRSNDHMPGVVSSASLDDESMVYVRGIDYKIAFKGCGIPLALSSIDGRFLDCNDTFLELTGYAREDLLPLEGLCWQSTVMFSPDQDESHKKNLSLFNLLSRDGMEQVFMAMSEMLKQPGSIGTTTVKPTEGSKLADFWSGAVKLCRHDLAVCCIQGNSRHSTCFRALYLTILF
jgi:PAS domain-containing protein